MVCKLTTIITVFITSLFLFISPVYAESISATSFHYNLIDYDQLSSIYNATRQKMGNVGDAIGTVSDTIDYDQLSSIYLTTKDVVGTVSDAMETVGEIVEIVTVGGTAICIASSIASTTVLPPAAALLPYCSAIGILDSGHAITKVAKQPKKAGRILSHAF